MLFHFAGIVRRFDIHAVSDFVIQDDKEYHQKTD
jgi:hypothetical protein